MQICLGLPASQSVRVLSKSDRIRVSEMLATSSEGLAGTTRSLLFRGLAAGSTSSVLW